MQAEHVRVNDGTGPWMEDTDACVHHMAVDVGDVARRDGPAKQRHEPMKLDIRVRAELPIPFASLCISRAPFCYTRKLAFFCFSDIKVRVFLTGFLELVIFDGTCKMCKGACTQAMTLCSLIERIIHVHFTLTRHCAF